MPDLGKNSDVLLRVDDRLRFGRATQSWVRHLGIETLIIADDRLAHDSIGKLFCELSRPSMLEQFVVSIDETAGLLEHLDGTRRVIMLMVGSIESAMRVLEHNPTVRYVNVAAFRRHANSVKYTECVYLDEYEESCCRYMMRRGIQVDLRTNYEDSPELLGTFAPPT